MGSREDREVTAPARIFYPLTDAADDPELAEAPV